MGQRDQMRTTVMRHKGIHWAWVILAVGFFDMFVNYSIRLGFGVALPEMIQSLGLNRTQGGTIMNCYLFTYVCVTPFTGNLTDRFGARRVITVFCAIMGLGAILEGTANNFLTACLFFALTGIGSSGMWTPVATVVQRWFAHTRRGLALGIISTGYGFGFATIGWVFPLLVSYYSWRLCWWTLGIATLVMVLFNGIFLRSRPEDLGMGPWGAEERSIPSHPQDKGPAEGMRYTDVFRTSRFWIIGASYGFAACALYIVTTFMVDYATAELGFSFKDASFIATIHGLTQVLGLLTIPMISDRIGRRLTLVGINTFVALSVIGVLMSGASIAGLYSSIAVMGIFYGATWPMYGACAGDYFGKEVIGTVIGAWTPLYGLGAIVGHFTGGRIRDVTQSFQWAFLLAVVFAIIAATLMHRVKEPSKE